MADSRHPRYVRHSIEQMFRQRVYSIAMGDEDLNNHATLRDDPVMQVPAELEDYLPRRQRFLSLAHASMVR